MIGAINDVLDWRWTFRILGMAGLVMVPVATLALWEPHDVWMKRKARQKGKASYSIKVGLSPSLPPSLTPSLSLSHVTITIASNFEGAKFSRTRHESRKFISVKCFLVVLCI